jgi:DnaJ-class molecular chaperone
LLGFAKTIKHLDGSLLNIVRHSGIVTGPNDVLLIKGKGMPFFNSDNNNHNTNTQYGDLYINIKVEFPKKLWLQKDEINTFKQLFPKDKSRVVKNTELKNEEILLPGRLDNFGNSGDTS